MTHFSIHRGAAVLAVAALIALGLAFARGEGSSAEALPQGGDVSRCAALEGEPARACYAREVGLELAAVGGAERPVTFTSAGTSAALLCDLHLRVGVTDADRASWTSWVAQ